MKKWEQYKPFLFLISSLDNFENILSGLFGFFNLLIQLNYKAWPGVKSK